MSTCPAPTQTLSQTGNPQLVSFCPYLQQELHPSLRSSQFSWCLYNNSPWDVHPTIRLEWNRVTGVWGEWVGRSNRWPDGSLISLASLANQAKNNNSKRQILEKLRIRHKCQWCMWIIGPKRMPGLSQATALFYSSHTTSSRIVCSCVPSTQWKAWVTLYSSGHWTHPPNFQLNLSYFLGWLHWNMNLDCIKWILS